MTNALTPQQPRPIVKRSAVEQVTTSLREYVLDGGVLPGRPLTEANLVKLYDVSRTTVRAAISALSNEGILVQKQNRRAEVARLTSSDIRDLYRVRRPLELEAVRIVIRKRYSVELSPSLSAAADELGRPASRAQHEVIDANVAFHQALIFEANNAPLRRCFAAIEGEIKLALSQAASLPEPEMIAKQHRSLLRSIAKGQQIWRDLQGRTSKSADKARDDAWRAAKDDLLSLLRGAEDALAGAM